MTHLLPFYIRFQFVCLLQLHIPLSPKENIFMIAAIFLKVWEHNPNAVWLHRLVRHNFIGCWSSNEVICYHNTIAAWGRCLSWLCVMVCQIVDDFFCQIPPFPLFSQRILSIVNDILAAEYDYQVDVWFQMIRYYYDNIILYYWTITYHGNTKVVVLSNKILRQSKYIIDSIYVYI